MMTVIYILAGIVLIILILGLMSPKNVTITRDILVERNPEQVFEHLKSLKKQTEWSPWHDRDPNIIHEYKGDDGEIGSIHYWKGNKDVGEGEQEITALFPNHRIESELRFLKPWKATNVGFFEIKEKENQTKVIWGFSASYNFPMNAMMVFVNMNKFIGKDFEKGLKKFKKIIEE
ncbi:MAG: SRPBCC family protein [Bacteroidales bacterium]|nr:SRPBCC family protein [Bacteroidales bacterium]